MKYVRVNVSNVSFDAVVAASSPTDTNGHSIVLNVRSALVREIYIIKE